MHIADLFDQEELLAMRLGGYVREQTHPTLPLSIVNYSEKAQFERVWNEVTLNCRGLIYDRQTREVIARGFRKFFNWDEMMAGTLPSGPVLRSPKMDGSLGILYTTGQESRSDGVSGPWEWSVATRGSFASDQAQWATKFLNEHDFEYWDLSDLNPEKSYLVEIIYPENRIVVNNGDQERLVLLDVLDTATGKSDLDEFDRVYWIDKVDRKLYGSGFDGSFVHDIPEGEEGFVIYWPHYDFRVKMKAAEYLELHRMIFSLSERSVWERLGAGETVQEICEKLPDEFHQWVNDVALRLYTQLHEVMMQTHHDYRMILQTVPVDRRDFALKAKAFPTKTYLFMMHDGKEIGPAIWKTLKPAGGKTVTTISEDVA